MLAKAPKSDIQKLYESCPSSKKGYLAKFPIRLTMKNSSAYKKKFPTEIGEFYPRFVYKYAQNIDIFCNNPIRNGRQCWFGVKLK